MQPISYSNDPAQNPYRGPPPPPPLPGVSVVEAFKFAFSPEGGIETILMGVLCLFIPIVGPIALKGYEADVLQRLVRRDAVPLPRFQLNAFTSYLTRGLPTFVVELVVWLPVVVVGVIFGGAVTVGLVVTGNAAHDVEGHAAVVTVIGMLVVAAMSFVATLGLTVVVNAASTRAALTEDIGASLNVRELLAYARRMFVPTLVAMVVFTVFAGVLFFAGVLAFFLCVYPAMVVIQLALTHLRFQIYERYVALGGTPIPLKPQALPAYYGGYGAGQYPGQYPGQAGQPPQQGYGGYQPPPNAQNYPPPRYPGQ